MLEGVQGPREDAAPGLCGRAQAKGRAQPLCPPATSRPADAP